MKSMLYRGSASAPNGRTRTKLLNSAMEKELLRVAVNDEQPAGLRKEARHMDQLFYAISLLYYPFPTTHSPHGGKYPNCNTKTIQSGLRTGMEECA